MSNSDTLAIIERNLWNYKENVARAAELGRNRSLEWLSVDYTRIRSSSHRNGTEEAIISTVSTTEELCRWCRVFEKTVERFHFDAKERFIRERYINHRTRYQVCEKIGISESTFANWRREILDIARRWAIEFHLIDP